MSSPFSPPVCLRNTHGRYPFNHSLSLACSSSSRLRSYGPTVASESSSIMSINVVTTIAYANGEVPPNPHSVVMGSTVVDNAIIRGITPPDLPKLARGTTTYQFFAGGKDGISRYCLGNHSDSTLTIGKTGKIPTSFWYNAWIPGSYAYRAVYDRKYGHIQSSCESLLVFAHPIPP